MLVLSNLDFENACPSIGKVGYINARAVQAERAVRDNFLSDPVHRLSCSAAGTRPVKSASPHEASLESLLVQM